ncbi:tetratricopeptide repeat-containing sensor histidine kinase [Flavobacterium sp.]|uniref:tetratricopeptide repeat-containing sensor histidine kinase n=1 Tax=Flavobacterium sp. TaxID=239 RepID=UPI002626BDE2|nr:tetratricopeptide repeat-containing sensor histidine kinase [Flavobacterium sp.]
MNKKLVILIFLLLLTILSCRKSTNQEYEVSQIRDSIAFYKKAIKFEKEDKDKIAYNFRLYNFLEQSDNSLLNRKNLDSVINNCYIFDDWNTYNLGASLLLKRARLSKDSLFMARAYRYKGNYFYKKKNSDSSFFYYLKSEKFYLNLKDIENYALVSLKKGVVELEINDFTGADVSLTKAYNILKRTDDYKRVYACLVTLGSISTELKEYNRAIDYYNRALSLVISQNLVDDDEKSNCLNNIGLVYSEKKEYTKAIYYFNKALSKENINKAESLDFYSLIIDNLAYTKLKSNDFNNLPNLFFESLEYRDQIENEFSKVPTYNHISEYYFKINDTANANKYFKKSLDLAYKSKIPTYIATSLKQGAVIDKKNSFEYSQKYIRISDSLQIEERNSKDRFARLQLETDEIIKQKNDLVEQNRDILNYFMGTMAFLGLLFFMRAQRARRRELVLTQAQQRANEELYKLIISQQHKLDEGKIYEKNRIAKELHDGVLGRMFGLRLNLDGLNKRNDDQAIEERLRCLEELKVIEQDLREISHELSREKFVLINNFVTIVNGLLEEQSKVNSAKLTTIIGENIDWDLLSNTTKINLYRILQESLQNINKYANANSIKIEFKKDKKGNLILNIVDDGDGYDLKKKSNGIGIKNMVDRTHESEGTIEIKSELKKGTQVLVVVPLESKTLKV